MIVYKLAKHISDQDFMEYNIMEYSDVMENDTRSDTDLPEMEGGCIHTATLAVCTVLGIFVLFLGCTGNGVALFNALTTKKLRSNFDLLIINLAGADFITCTCLAPIFLFLLFSDSPIPEVFCGSVMFLGITSCFLSILSIVSISVHRYCRVRGRLKSPLTLQQTSSIVGVTWLISISLALGSTLQMTSSWNQGTMNECKNVVNSDDSATNNFMLYFMCPITAFSLGIIIMCYGTIANMVRGKTSPESVMSPVRNENYIGAIHCEALNGDNQSGVVIPADKCACRTADIPQDNGCKAVTVCIVVILTVTLCWGPFVTSQLVELATGESIILYQVKLCGIALIFLNSALNPYLYGQTGGRIKHKYTKMLYSFARCEYRFNHSNKLRKRDKKALEACPLKSPLTQDTVSAQTDCGVGFEPRPMPNRKEYGYHNANFTQNLLYMHSDNFISKLTGSKTCSDDHSPDVKVFESNRK